MAKPPIVEDKDLDHLIKVTRATSGPNALRNVALVYTLFGTGMMPSEIASLKVSDYLEKGQPKEDTQVRPEISFNGRSRPLGWVNKTLVKAIDAYLAERAEKRIAATPIEAGYRGLDPASPLFLSRGEEGFAFRETVSNGKTYRSCGSLVNLLNRMIAGSGLEGCNTGSAPYCSDGNVIFSDLKTHIERDALFFRHVIYNYCMSYYNKLNQRINKRFVLNNILEVA